MGCTKPPARVRRFSVGSKHYPQSFVLARKCKTKRAAEEFKKELKGRGYHVRIVKTKKTYNVYGSKWWGRI